MTDEAVSSSLAPYLVGIDHVGIAVPSLDAAVDFHCSLFGLVVTHREINEEQGVAEAMLAAPDSADGTVQIQLLAPLRPESAIATFIGRSGPGLQQLAYRVTDVAAAADVLRSAGVRVLYAESRRGTAGSLINFAHPKDTGGVLIELVQPAERRHT